MSTREELIARPEKSRYGLNSGHLAFTTFAFFVAFGANGIKNAFGWWTWGACVLLVFGVALTWLIRSRAIARFGRLPLPLLGFSLLVVVSLAWSQWRPETLLGIVVFGITILSAFALGSLNTLEELVVALSGATRWVIGLSFLFELWVSLVIRHPVLPVWLSGDPTTADLQLLWSRDLLLETGKIQGIVGNSSILAQVAAVALVALVVQFAIGRIGRVWGAIWLAVILLTLVLTASATMTIALVVTALVAVLVLVRRQISGGRSRTVFWAVVVAAVAAAAIVVSLNVDRIFALFGKDDTLTGRTTIWANTIGLANEHPVFGWGWLGYWPPWLAPLNTLNVRYGVAQLHAHDAWVDLYLQLGVVGIVVFAILLLWTITRSYRVAIVPRDNATLLPVLVVALFAVQTITESGILVQEGLFLFATLVVALGRMRPR